MISLSLLSTPHHPYFQLWCVRSSRRCYPPFNLDMGRSQGFRVYAARLYALLRLAFATATPYGLTLPRIVTHGLIMQKVRGHTLPCGHSAPTACRHAVSGTISLPSQGFFSPFPHGTSSLSVASEYLALPDGPGRFPQGSTCPAVLRSHLKEDCIFEYGAVTLYGRPFQTVLLTLPYPSFNQVTPQNGVT